MVVDWYNFLLLATRHLTATVQAVDALGGGPTSEPRIRSWCAFTTFPRLEMNAGYWTDPLPEESELLPTHTTDGGTWGQPFSYDEFAHFIIPARYTNEGWSRRRKYFIRRCTQDIEGLSRLLADAKIEHRLSSVALEIKLF
jgi:hypothetical protein